MCHLSLLFPKPRCRLLRNLLYTYIFFLVTDAASVDSRRVSIQGRIAHISSIREIRSTNQFRAGCDIYSAKGLEKYKSVGAPSARASSTCCYCCRCSPRQTNLPSSPANPPTTLCPHGVSNAAETLRRDESTNSSGVIFYDSQKRDRSVVSRVCRAPLFFISSSSST